MQFVQRPLFHSSSPTYDSIILTPQYLTLTKSNSPLPSHVIIRIDLIKSVKKGFISFKKDPKLSKKDKKELLKSPVRHVASPDNGHSNSQPTDASSSESPHASTIRNHDSGIMQSIEGDTFQFINHLKVKILLDLPSKLEETTLNNLIQRLNQVKIQLALNRTKNSFSGSSSGTFGSGRKSRSASSTVSSSSVSDLMVKSSTYSSSKNEKKSHKLSKKERARKQDSYFSCRDERLFNDAVEVLRQEQMNNINARELITQFHTWKLHPITRSSAALDRLPLDLVEDAPSPVQEDNPLADSSSVGDLSSTTSTTPNNNASTRARQKRKFSLASATSADTSPFSPSMEHFPRPSLTRIIREFKNVELLQHFNRIHGLIAFTNTHLYFIPAFYGSDQVKMMKKIPLRQVRTVLKQRFVGREVALEIFLFHRSTAAGSQSITQTMSNSLFLVFPSSEERNAMCTLFRGKMENVQESLQVMSKKWTEGIISNYDYLLFLNQRAGRTFHDISQYPIFPWIIADYNSPTLDLNKSSTYRDLSKPVGALNEERLQQFIQRSKECELPYLYSTHYSTPGYVAYFLVRTYPELILSLHSGKYDVADRLFHNIASTFHGSTNSQSDIKELIPEFFTGDGAFLTNIFNLPLGCLQHSSDNQIVDDVHLPPWASSPEEFIQINRAALESAHVSCNLHKWINLIFGFQQLPKYAAEVHNTFPTSMYKGVDYLLEEDPCMDEATATLQAYEFGQMPRCLFPTQEESHPQRVTQLEKSSRIIKKMQIEMQQLKEENENRNHAVSNLQEELSSLHSQLEEKNGTISTMEENTNQLASEMENLRSTLSSHKQQESKAQELVENLEEQVKKLHQEVKKPPAKLYILPDQVVNDINQGQERVSIQNYVQNLEREVKNLLTQNERIEGRLSAEKEKNAKKEQRMRKLRAEIEQHRTLKNNLRSKSIRSEKRTSRLSQLEQENQQLREMLAQRDAELSLQTADQVTKTPTKRAKKDAALEKRLTSPPRVSGSPAPLRLMRNDSRRPLGSSSRVDSKLLSPKKSSQSTQEPIVMIEDEYPMSPISRSAKRIDQRFVARSNSNEDVKKETVASVKDKLNSSSPKAAISRPLSGQSAADRTLKSALDKTPIEIPYNYDESML